MVLCKPQANIPFLHELQWVKKADPFLFLLTARHSKTLGLDGFKDLRTTDPPFSFAHTPLLPQHAGFW
jgi:hypothetical protein